MANTDNYRRGTVRWFSARRGYGFLADENGIDYFVHFSEILCDGFKKLSAGEAVQFTAGEDSQGRTIAKEVTPLNEGINENLPETEEFPDDNNI